MSEEEIYQCCTVMKRFYLFMWFNSLNLTRCLGGLSSKLCGTNLPKCMYTLVGKASVQNYVGQICQSVCILVGKASESGILVLTILDLQNGITLTVCNVD